uniref:EF-hand domain-containing protein n=1 Tax=Pyrodinium bahamense TaxID=73915 RepID=A0A7R9ZVC0_9DINO|mmetsp:Transcript_11352/g.30976  ORF Transcript_11352/g.30976 Transcript_11352/m.30976 type:complete len:442 (+) Transcript_11352:96-1421(+)
MGSGASAGISAAAKAASDDELENLVGHFSVSERGKLAKALSEDPPSKPPSPGDELFKQVDLNSDGIIDAVEWKAARARHLVRSPEQKTPLDLLLDAFDVEGTGRLDSVQVAEAIDLFNGLDKREPLKPIDEDDTLQKPRVGKDGKVGRKAVGALLTLYSEGPPTRPMDQVVQVFQEMHSIKQFFLEWEASDMKLTPDAVNTVVSLFNKWADRAHPGNERGRMRMQFYDPQQYRPEIVLASFTNYLWQELKSMEELFTQPFESTLARLRESRNLAAFLARLAEEGLTRVPASCFGPVVAARDGKNWEGMETAEREGVEGRVAEQCGFQSDPKGRVDGKDLFTWIQDEVIQLPVEQITAMLPKLEEFRVAAAKEETVTRIHLSFEKWDTNSHGTIARKDLREVMSKIEGFTPEELDALMYGAKPDKQGRIDYAEFTKWVLAAP